jgi:hypothetical protein
LGKAFRSDSIGSAEIAAEIAAIEQRDDALEPETVRCPVGECPVTYAVYNYLFSDREANLASLMYGLKIHHPNHPVRAVLNEPRME